MNTQAVINPLSTEYLQWLTNLSLYKNELKSLENSLSKLSIKISRKDLLAKVEQFQNRFIRQREVLDELRHEIKQYENHLEEGNLNEFELQIEHYNLKEQFTRFYDLFIELERDFDEFLA
ncbi:MAG: hypothetical protein ACK4K9_06995 [Bacteroidia bacterium]